MPTNPSWSILLIEKSKDLQSLIQLSIIHFSIDATVYMVYSVAEAIDHLQRSLPDIIFLGIEHNGLESLIELMAQPTVQTIPIVALTHRVRLSEQRQFQQSGARAILEYSFDPNHLQTLLQELSDPG